MVTLHASQWSKRMTGTKFITAGSLITLIFLSIQTSTYADIYKWTDSDGQIHYSDRPQANDAEKVTIHKNTTTTPRQLKANNESDASNESEETTESKPDNKPKMVEVEPSRKDKNRLCDEARRDIASINSRGRMREINSNGEYVYLSEQQRQQRLSAAKKKQREFCR